VPSAPFVLCHPLWPPIPRPLSSFVSPEHPLTKIGCRTLAPCCHATQFRLRGWVPSISLPSWLYPFFGGSIPFSGGFRVAPLSAFERSFSAAFACGSGCTALVVLRVARGQADFFVSLSSRDGDSWRMVLMMVGGMVRRRVWMVGVVLVASEILRPPPFVGAFIF